MLAKKEIRLHALCKDTVARLLFFNAFFVIAGYALTNATDKAIIGIISDFKNTFLFISFVYLVVRNKIVNPFIYFDSGFIPILFGAIILYISIGSGADDRDFFRTYTFLVPLIYIYLSLGYLISNYGMELTLKAMHYGLLIIYCIPLLSYIASGGNIQNTNIYGGASEDQFFASNNYGWSATIYILSYLFVWKDIQLRKYVRFFFGIMLPIAVILLLASANRASWLSMSFAMIPFFYSYKKVKLIYKFAGLLVILGFISYLLSDPNSSINFAKSKSKTQEQKGELRFETAKVMTDAFNSEKTRWITGIGMFNYDLLKNRNVLNGYHNSYYEVLFGAGILLFIMFLSFMLFRPVSRFIKYYSHYTLLLPPLVIIPFFESNLTGGQFLFFPWFSFILLLNVKIKFWNKETFAAYIKKKKIISDSDIRINETNNPIL